MGKHPVRMLRGFGRGEHTADVQAEATGTHHEATRMPGIRRRSLVDRFSLVCGGRYVAVMLSMVRRRRRHRCFQMPTFQWAQPARLDKREVREREDAQEGC